jgi:hypothetical protein
MAMAQDKPEDALGSLDERALTPGGVRHSTGGPERQPRRPLAGSPRR